MTNAMTGRPLTVDTHPQAPPRLRLPKSQIETVSHLLNQHDIKHEVSEWLISVDGRPETGAINFGWKVDGNTVQAVLDAVA